jgi:hypothetical protein
MGADETLGTRIADTLDEMMLRKVPFIKAVEDVVKALVDEFDKDDPRWIRNQVNAVVRNPGLFHRDAEHWKIWAKYS